MLNLLQTDTSSFYASKTGMNLILNLTVISMLISPAV